MKTHAQMKHDRALVAILAALALLLWGTASLAEQSRERPPRAPRPAPAPAPVVVPQVAPVPPVPPVPLVAGVCDGDQDCPQQFLFARSRVYLGVHLLGITPELRTFFGAPEDAGLLVSRVEQGGPAQKGNVKVGDVILEVDGHKVGDVGALRRAVGQKKSGDIARIKAIRSRKHVELKVKVMERTRSQVDLGRVFEHGWPGDLNIEIDERALEEATKQFEKKVEQLEEKKQRLNEREKELEKRLKEMEKRLRELEKKVSLKIEKTNALSHLNFS